MPYPPFISLDENSQDPLYLQIYETVRQAILSGRFYTGMPLPASRLLAKQLKISRMTVVNAYEQLIAEGYLETKSGAGTFVTSHLPEEYLQAAAVRQKKKDVSAAARKIKLSEFGNRISQYRKNILSDFGGTSSAPFQQGVPDLENFPFETWGKISQKWRRRVPESLLQYQDPAGFYPLREAIAEHLVSTRGLRCEAEQVLIVNGTQQGLDLINRVFLGDNAEFCVEDPGYAAGREFYAAGTAKMIPVPLDAEGFALAEAKKLCENPRLVYVTPSFQYPLGITMSLARRMNLLEWANERGAFVVEDDYNSEFRYASRPLAALQGLDRHGRVIYLGTFSKTIFPSLRLGCLVAPPDLVETFGAAKALADYHTSPFEQAILAEFIREKHFARHVRKMREIYEKRQTFLVEEAKKQLKGLLKIEAADAGMHLVGWLPEDICDREVAQEAAKVGLKIRPLSSLCINAKLSGLILGYTAFNEKQIKAGMKKLAKVIENFC